jgi:hypothetical protein
MILTTFNIYQVTRTCSNDLVTAWKNTLIKKYLDYLRF